MKNNKCAIYLRLSRDDGIKTESESIQSQRMFLREYCDKNGFEIEEEYCDDGYTGTNFDRPDFRRMINDALSKRFTAIITKDMSRLGRDYIETGKYIEKIFPSNSIRYIAVNDGVDTFSDVFGNDMIPFKAVFNDMYAKDISRKVRTALDSKKRAGKFIGSFAPYGYKKDPYDRSRLVPDDSTREVVLRIYDEFLNGKSMLSIAKGLTDDGIKTPSEIKNSGGRKSSSWNSVMIKRILTNPTYKGNITQNFCRKVNYKTQRRVVNPRCEYIIVCGTHDGIIDEKMFDEVAQKLEKKQK